MSPVAFRGQWCDANALGGRQPFDKQLRFWTCGVAARSAISFHATLKTGLSTLATLESWDIFSLAWSAYRENETGFRLARLLKLVSSSQFQLHHGKKFSCYMTKCFLMAFCLPFCLNFKGGKDESGQVPRFVFTGRPAAVSAYCIFGRNKPVKNEIQGLVDKRICTAACLPNFRFRKKSVLFDGLFCFIIERLYFVPWCSFRFFPQPVCCWPWSRDAVLHLEHFSKLFFALCCLGAWVVSSWPPQPASTFSRFFTGLTHFYSWFTQFYFVV